MDSIEKLSREKEHLFDSLEATEKLYTTIKK